MVSHIKIVLLTHIEVIRGLKVKYIVNLWIKDTSIQGTKCRVPLCPLKRGSTVMTKCSTVINNIIINYLTLCIIHNYHTAVSLQCFLIYRPAA